MHVYHIYTVACDHRFNNFAYRHTKCLMLKIK